jgi:hypothetical protein
MVFNPDHFSVKLVGRNDAAEHTGTILLALKLLFTRVTTPAPPHDAAQSLVRSRDIGPLPHPPIALLHSPASHTIVCLSACFLPPYRRSLARCLRWRHDALYALIIRRLFAFIASISHNTTIST